MKDPSETGLLLPWSDDSDLSSICSSWGSVGSLSVYMIPFIAVLILLGVFLFAFGYRFHRLSAFSVCLILGFAFAYLLCTSEQVFDLYANAGIALICGFVCAVIAALHSKIGFFIMGFGVGAILGAYTVIAAALTFEYESVSIWMGISLCFLLGVIVGVLSLLWQRTLSIFNTSLASGFLFFVAVDAILEQMVLVRFGWVLLTEGQKSELCELSLFSLAVWPAVFLLGLFIQFLKTARYFDHLEKKSESSDDETKGTSPKASQNNTYRKSGSIDAGQVRTNKGTMKGTRTQARYTGDVLSKTNAGGAITQTVARMRGMAGGGDLGPEYQVMGSTVYYGDTYSEYGAQAGMRTPGGGPRGGPRTLPGGRPPGGPPNPNHRRQISRNRQSQNPNDPMYEDVEDQYCAIDDEMARNYEYQYGVQYAQYQYEPVAQGPPGAGPGPGNNIYRQQQSRTSTLGSTRSGASRAQPPPQQQPGGPPLERQYGGALYQQVSQDYGPSASVSGSQENMLQSAGLRGPSRAPPPPPSMGMAPVGAGPSGPPQPQPLMSNEDYLSPVTNSAL